MKSVTDVSKEIEDAKVVFTALDKDKSGFLDRAEMKELGKKLKNNWNDDEVEAIFDRCDKDGSNAVTFDEFCTWFAPHLEEKKILAEIQKNHPDSVAARSSPLPVKSPKHRELKKKRLQEIENNLKADRDALIAEFREMRKKEAEAKPKSNEAGPMISSKYGIPLAAAGVAASLGAVYQSGMLN